MGHRLQVEFLLKANGHLDSYLEISDSRNSKWNKDIGFEVNEIARKGVQGVFYRVACILTCTL